ncbi:MAG TPA: hypothetical protein VNJ02_00150 [Vicinamibacterales bacterium]|nr:hypothetical protein [Vicinamibacterales bacterium]
MLAAVADRTPDQRLVGVRAIHIRGIEEIDAEVERAVKVAIDSLSSAWP